MSTYIIRRHDSHNFHGWIVFECYEGVEEEYFSSTSLEECREIIRDLDAL